MITVAPAAFVRPKKSRLRVLPGCTNQGVRPPLIWAKASAVPATGVSTKRAPWSQVMKPNVVRAVCVWLTTLVSTWS